MSLKRSDVYLHLCLANGRTRAETAAAHVLFVSVTVEKFNHGVSAESKKLAWAEITNQINALGENHREVRLSVLVDKTSGMIWAKMLQSDMSEAGLMSSVYTRDQRLYSDPH